MKKLFMTGLLLAATTAWAQTSTVQTVTDKAKSAVAMAVCETCGTVQSVTKEKRKGKGGILGVAGGAVAGGVLGNQVGKGSGNTVATVGGAVAGGVIGNEVQKQMTSKKVYVTSVKMKDGSVKTFEQESQPAWAAGNVVRVSGTTLTKQ